MQPLKSVSRSLQRHLTVYNRLMPFRGGLQEMLPFKSSLLPSSCLLTDDMPHISIKSFGKSLHRHLTVYNRLMPFRGGLGEMLPLKK
jgi:hypothetical protein